CTGDPPQAHLFLPADMPLPTINEAFALLPRSRPPSPLREISPFKRHFSRHRRGPHHELSEVYQRPKTRLEPSRVVLYPFAQHSVRHGDPLEHHGGRYDAPPLASRHRLQILGTCLAPASWCAGSAIK